MKNKIIISVITVVVIVGLILGGYHLRSYYFAGEYDMPPYEEAPVNNTIQIFDGEYSDFLYTQAKKQFDKGDHTPLKEPVEYNILWLGYRTVVYEKLKFTMNDTDEEYLKNVVKNFEKTVEKMSNYNVDINIDLHFLNDKRILTYDDYEHYLYLDQPTVKQDIDKFNKGEIYDSVITTVQGEGDDNYQRRERYPQYSEEEYYIILGLCTLGVDTSLGYSTFNLSMPLDDEIEAPDPEVPSLYATAVAVHEWLHQFESITSLIDIEFPPVHLYMGGEEFAGYGEYIENENNYDFFELYEEIMLGEVPYTSPEGEKMLLGMYPKFWQIVKKTDVFLGQFTISDVSGEKFLGADDSCSKLILSEEEFLWDIVYRQDGTYTLTPSTNNEYFLDVSDATATNGNPVKLCGWTGYESAQTWNILINEDGYSIIETAIEGDYALSYNDSQKGAVLTDDVSSGEVYWVITEVE